jgi:hypothetical protein
MGYGVLGAVLRDAERRILVLRSRLRGLRAGFPGQFFPGSPGARSQETPRCQEREKEAEEKVANDVFSHGYRSARPLYRESVRV